MAKLEASRNYLPFGGLYRNNLVSQNDWLFFMSWAASLQIIHICIHIHLPYQQAELASQHLLRCNSQNSFLVL